MKHPNVKYVEADSIVKTTNQTANWGYNTLNIQTAKSMGLTGNGIKIAIIDTGINLDHPDLKISGGQSFVEGISRFDDDFGHGTHVAGIIAAQDNEIGIIGVAPDSQIYSVKVLNKFGEGVQSNVIAGINWAIEQQMDVINLSITSQQGSYLLKEALQNAYDQGIIIVAASGNYLTNNVEGTDVLYPARYPSVIAVGSIDENLKKSSFSYYGNSLEFVAPGENIRSTYIENSGLGYSELTGTSMAAPYVAGIAALYMQQYPMMSNVEIRHLMQRNAMDLGETGKDIQYGYGLVPVPTTNGPFLDMIESTWYTDEINDLYNQGIVTGYPGGLFHPENFVTRSEAVTMVGRALKLPGTPNITMFSDVYKEDYSSGYINSATNENIITGYPDQTFRPNSYIKRGDVAAILQRSYQFPTVSEIYYSDVKNENYYDDAINSIAALNIYQSYQMEHLTK